MQSKIPFKRSFLTVGILVILLFSITILFRVLHSPRPVYYTKPDSPAESQPSKNLIEGKAAESIKSTAFKEQASSILAIRLKIPKINLNAAIESVGLTPDGAMDAPKGPTNTAWFNLGPSPGEKGSAVIDGHFGWYNGKPAVFDDLNKLQKGDKLYVEDETGASTTFVVRMSRSYDPKADATDVFGSDDGKAHLNLITCEGVWDKATKSYSNRLVVFSDKEMQ